MKRLALNCLLLVCFSTVALAQSTSSPHGQLDLVGTPDLA